MLVTLADMKAHLKIDSGNTDNDSFLTDQLNLISDTVEAYCQRVFSQATYTQTFYHQDYTYGMQLETFHFPLISVTSITEGADLLDPSYYRVHKPTGLITRNSSAFFICQDVTVVYSAGYATIPTPIQSVVMSLVEERYNRKNTGVSLNFGSDVQSISVPGSISIAFDYSLSNNDRSNTLGTLLGSYVNVLDHYRSDRAIIGSGKITYL